MTSSPTDTSLCPNTVSSQGDQLSPDLELRYPEGKPESLLGRRDLGSQTDCTRSSPQNAH